MDIIAAQYHSPFGLLTVGSFGERICMCDWADRRNSQQIFSRITRSLRAEIHSGTSAAIESAISQLEEYFAGCRRQFDLQVLLCGTDFQQSVWEALLTLPYGATASYSDLAALSGHGPSVRAVANAIGANAISIVIPCHRVIGSDGTLTGYAGGIEAKRRLLQLEHSDDDGDTLSSLSFDRDSMM